MECIYCGHSGKNLKEVSVKYGRNSVAKIFACSKCLVERDIIEESVILKGTPSFILFMIFFQNPKFLRECSSCKTILKDVLITGKVGCCNCYNTFKDEIQALVYGNSEDIYRGTIPIFKKNSQLQEYKNYLKEKLNKLVEADDFESAAIIRDDIYSIEEKRYEEK